MSTKIYSGCLLEASSILDLNDKLKAYRTVAQEVAVTLYHKTAAKMVTSYLDRKALGYNVAECEEADSYEGAVAITVVWDHIRRRQDRIVATMRRDPEVDFHIEVSIIPIAGKILGILYTEQEALERTWWELPWVKPYGYWNNSDRPDDVTEGEWRQRKFDWEEALPGLGIPEDNGFQATFVPIQSRWLGQVAQILPHVPSFDQRLTLRASDAVLFERIEADRKETGERPYFKWLRWLRTEEGQRAVAQQVEEFRGKLLPEITEEVLRNPAPAPKTAEE